MLAVLKRFITKQLIAPGVTNPISQDLKNLVIVITGASRGAGKATAHILHRDGAKIVLISRHKEDEQNVYKKTNNVLSLECDITNEKDVEKTIKIIIQKYSRIDVLIKNVGIFLDKSLDETSIPEFEKIVNTNIKGMFLMSKYALPYMKKKKGGYIINIGSKISHNTHVEPHKVLYAMTKYAVEGFSYALHNEVKPHSIKVTCLMPGAMSNFISRKSKDFLSPSYIGMVISNLIKMKDVDFQSILFTSVKQNL